MDEIWKLSTAYAREPSDVLSFSLGATFYFVGNAALEQSAQRLTVQGDFDTNMLAIPRGSLRYGC